MVRKILLRLVIFLALCLAAAGLFLHVRGEREEAYAVAGLSDRFVTKKEVWCRNGKNKIYGLLLIAGEDAEWPAYSAAKAQAGAVGADMPETPVFQAEDGRIPLIIFSHALGGDLQNGFMFAETMLPPGCAFYCFDFCGGSRDKNRSGGKKEDMSVLTEAGDLEAVIREARTWDFVDPDRIVLMGVSQGGAVTALTGCRMQEETDGMILFSPGLNVTDITHEAFPDISEIPESYKILDGFYKVGRAYGTDVWDIDIYKELSGYKRKVLLFHGSRDRLVDVSYSRRAAEVIPDCEYHESPKAGHSIDPEDFRKNAAYTARFLWELWGNQQ
jgi:predicted esterase